MGSRAPLARLADFSFRPITHLRACSQAIVLNLSGDFQLEKKAGKDNVGVLFNYSYPTPRRVGGTHL